MNGISDQQQAVELLQQLGFKEYEAKCFVALSRLPKGTAKDISETSDVPRTRVYDAIRVLETRGLVEIQHTNPQQFRAVPVDEAITLLQEEYDTRTQNLGRVLRDIESLESEVGEEVTYEVWAISGANAIKNRARELIADAEREVVLVVGEEETFTDELAEQLRAVETAGVDVVIGAVSDELRDHVRAALPEVEVFTSGLEWLSGPTVDADDTTSITRLLLVDGSTILVSSVHDSQTRTDESAVFGKGFDNGLVVITRRLMATGLSGSGSFP